MRASDAAPDAAMRRVLTALAQGATAWREDRYPLVARYWLKTAESLSNAELDEALVARLCRAGMVRAVRRPRDNDLRNCRYALSDKGRAALERKPSKRPTSKRGGDERYKDQLTRSIENLPIFDSEP